MTDKKAKYQQSEQFAKHVVRLIERDKALVGGDYTKLKVSGEIIFWAKASTNIHVRV